MKIRVLYTTKEGDNAVFDKDANDVWIYSDNGDTSIRLSQRYKNGQPLDDIEVIFVGPNGKALAYFVDANTGHVILRAVGK